MAIFFEKTDPLFHWTVFAPLLKISGPLYVNFWTTFLPLPQYHSSLLKFLIHNNVDTR